MNKPENRNGGFSVGCSRAQASEPVRATTHLSEKSPKAFESENSGVVRARIISEKGILAFTLAEVLITLVIIGVIAAMTVPTLMAQHRKTEYITQYKHAYSMLSNGFKLAMAKDGVTTLEDTTLFSSINGSSTTTDGQDAFIKNFSSIFTEMKVFERQETPEELKVMYNLLTKKERTFSPLNYSRMSFFLNNGSVIYAVFFKTEDDMDVLGSATVKNVGNIFIDVNGAKPPNTAGRDLFYLFVQNNGQVVPHGSAKYSGTHWRTKNYCSLSQTSIANSLACSGRIIEEGWQMNY